MTYEATLKDIEDVLMGVLDEYHIQSVIDYLARICEAIPAENISGSAEQKGNVAPFREAAAHLKAAHASLNPAGYCTMPLIF